MLDSHEGKKGVRPALPCPAGVRQELECTHHALPEANTHSLGNDRWLWQPTVAMLERD